MDFTKVIRPMTIKTCDGGWVSVYCKIKYTDSRLSITGVIGPTCNGNAYGGCGQINMEFENGGYPSRHYASGWSGHRFGILLDIWDKYHLNDLQAACEHQRELGWTYKTHPSATCPICGYNLGNKWKTMDVPQHWLNWLGGLPDTDRKPAWV